MTARLSFIAAIRRWAGLCAVLAVAALVAGCGGLIKGDARANQPLKADAVARLATLGSSPAEGMVIRIFKQSSELEVWKRASGGDYKLFRTYEICAWSGELGPKVREGDRQSPEGFYSITAGLLNPKSSYYLSFDTGFPNKFDRAHGRTGSNLMVHGDCSSRGCYSMTDESIAEIYALVRESLKGGNASVQLQIFPFRMTTANLAANATSPNLDFWKDIKEGYDRFEIDKRPPVWDVCNREYVFDMPGTGLSATGACPVDPTTTLTTALVNRQAADDAAIAKALADLSTREAKALADAERQAKLEAEAAARGEAVDAFFGGIVGGLFGGEQVEKVIDPTLEAPKPATRPKRS